MAASRAADRRATDELVEAPLGGARRSEIDQRPAGVDSTTGSDYYRVFLRNWTGFGNEILANQSYTANIMFSGGFSQVEQLLDEKYPHLAGL